MKINYKKSLKFITLLLASLLIATVSADVYNYLFLNTSITVEGLPLAWAEGTGTGLSWNIKGATCTISGMKGPANGTKVYSDAVHLTASANTIFNLRIASVTGANTSMSSIIVKLYDGSNNTKGTLTVWTGSAKGSDLTNLSITQSETWRLQWEITWAYGAAGTVYVQLKVEIPVS
jgi:hypothetical protein